MQKYKKKTNPQTPLPPPPTHTKRKSQKPPPPSPSPPPPPPVKAVSVYEIKPVPLTLSMLCNFACFFLFLFFLSSVEIFLTNFFKKTSFRNTIRMSNRLDPDQARNFVGPDLDPNCLQRLLAADKKSPPAGKQLKPRV